MWPVKHVKLLKENNMTDYDEYKDELKEIEEQKYGKDIPLNVKKLDNMLEKISSKYNGLMERSQ